MTRDKLIQKHIDLFWYFDKSKVSEISNEVLVEFILNYGDMQSVYELFECLGIQKVAEIFSLSIKYKRHNFLPQAKNYFLLLFKKHAPQYFI